MTNEQAYETWAPRGGTWSAWVAPALFSALNCGPDSPQTFAPLNAKWFDRLNEETALILDVEGVEAVRLAIGLAEIGVTPVPLFNASPTPTIGVGISELADQQPFEVVPMRELIIALCWGTYRLAEIQKNRTNSSHSAPAFLLDARRTKEAGNARLFDNRWMLVPQDFPTAAFLKQKGIKQVLLVQQEISGPQQDLLHVLLPYRKAGLDVLGIALNANEPVPLRLREPSVFKGLLNRTLARFGLRKHSLGGFGSWFPESGSGG